jgi:hypothetical protein
MQLRLTVTDAATRKVLAVERHLDIGSMSQVVEVINRVAASYPLNDKKLTISLLVGKKS